MRDVFKKLTAAALGGAMVFATLTVAQGSTPEPTVVDIGDGVQLTLIRERGQAIRVLEFSPRRAVVAPVAAGARFPMRQPPSAIASHTPAIATVGGDFSALHAQPKHILVVDREMWTSGLQHGWAFETAGDHAYIGKTWLDIELRREDGPPIRIREWNADAPILGDVVAYTPRGGKTEHPRGTMHPGPTSLPFCAALLKPTGDRYWSASQKATLRDYVVERQPERCKKTPMPFQGPQTVVLDSKANGPGAAALRSLTRHERVTLSMNLGHPGVTDVAGGMPQIIEDGVNIAPNHPRGSYRAPAHDASARGPDPDGPDGSFFGPNPRTALGITQGCETGDESCRILVVTIDGRLAPWSAGVRLPWLADLMLRLGAWQAVNMDGGGSTMMWVRHKGAYCQSSRKLGCLVNRTSYGERPNVDAVTIKPR